MGKYGWVCSTCIWLGTSVGQRTFWAMHSTDSNDSNDCGVERVSCTIGVLRFLGCWRQQGCILILMVH